MLIPVSMSWARRLQSSFTASTFGGSSPRRTKPTGDGVFSGSSKLSDVFERRFFVRTPPLSREASLGFPVSPEPTIGSPGSQNRQHRFPEPRDTTIRTDILITGSLIGTEVNFHGVLLVYGTQKQQWPRSQRGHRKGVMRSRCR